MSAPPSSATAERLVALVDSMATAILVEDEHRRVAHANRAFCFLFGINAPPEALLGSDCAEAAARASQAFVEPEAFVARVDEILRAGVPVRGERLHRVDGRILERDYEAVTVDGRPGGHLWQYRDITVAERDREQLAASNRMLEAIDRAQGSFFRETSAYDLFSGLLDSLLDLTESEYGYIAEVLHDEEGEPYLKTWAVTDIAWNEATKALYDEAAARRDGLEFRNLDTLFGWSLRVEEPVIANDAPTDPRRGGIPEGHPPLRCFLGVPLRRGGRTVGHLGVANRPGGYDQALLDYLEPFATACANLIEAYRTDAERRAAETGLLRAVREAEAANHAKSEFLSRMSHELRTPLNAVIGFAQVLQLEEPREEQVEPVEHILNAGRHLLGLIDEVLDIARIETGRLSLAAEVVRFDEVLHEALDLLRGLAADVGATVVEDPSCRDVAVLADRRRLKQVLVNLLSNALKYNQRGGRVEVRVVPGDAQQLRIEVADTGPGIPPALHGRLFLPFDRLGAEQTGVEGTGIGLTITKRLVDAMSGAIGVDSVVGEGSTFWFTLPAVEAAACSAGHAGCTDELHELVPPAHRQPRWCVLYIEDNDSNVALVRRVLTRLRGIELEHAPDAATGLAAARRCEPDLILLDLHLPDAHGKDVLRALRAEPDLAAVPVVVLSADAMPSRVQDLLDAGAVAYLTKPVDVAALVATVQDLLVADGTSAWPESA